jgi:putative membrane protein
MDSFDAGVSEYTESVKTLTSTNENIAALLTAYVKANPGASQDANIQKITAIFQQSQGSLDKLDKASDAIKQSSSALAGASKELASGSKQLNDGIVKLAEGAKPLATGAATLATGAASLAEGLDSVSNGTAQMLGGMAQAAGSTTKLNEGYAAIDAGVQKASESIGTAATNAGLLAAAADKVSTGAGELHTGVARLADGGNALKDGSIELLDGETKLRDGAAELDDKVKEASDKVRDNTSEVTEKLPKLEGLAEYVADPVRIDEEDVDKVSDYGTAFAPYFVSLSLWVGALIMFVVIYLNPQIRFRRKLVKGAHMDIKFLMYPLISIAQGGALAFILLEVLHLGVTNKALFYGVVILAALCFNAIIQFLIVNLGDVGKFLAMLMLILQLTSSGGTFPNELVPKFFNMINAYMPMTYSIYALKEVISGGNGTFLLQNILILAGILVVFLLASLLLTGNKTARSIDDVESEYIQKREKASAEA